MSGPLILRYVKIRQHQLMDVIIANMLIAACVVSYLKSKVVLDKLNTVSSYFMLATIVFGIVIAIYVIYTKDQVFDPLNSSLVLSVIRRL